MFFRKPKKEENKPTENETIDNDIVNNAVFGSLEFVDCAFEGYSKSSLFGEEKDIDLLVYVDEDERIVAERQEKAYLNYIRSRKEIEEAIRNAIIRHFKLPEDFDLGSRFRAFAVVVTMDGNCGLVIIDNTYSMGHHHYKFVVDTESGHEVTDTYEYYLNTK